VTTVSNTAETFTYGVSSTTLNTDEITETLQNQVIINAEQELLFGVYEGEAICHFDKKEFEKAAEIWKEWLNRKTDIYKDHALYYIGLSYEKSGKDDEALSYYKRLKDEHPDSLLIVKINDKVPAQIETAPKPAEN